MYYLHWYMFPTAFRCLIWLYIPKSEKNHLCVLKFQILYNFLDEKYTCALPHCYDNIA